jgi:hypothetical protein
MEVSLLPRTARANAERIEKETKKIKWLVRMKLVDHPPNTVELAFELHYERGYYAAAIINSATHNFRRIRPLHQKGKLNTLKSPEVLELRYWLNLKILRHEQPKISEVQHAVFFFSFV